ncbi:helix-turn-helix transcriptional regulator [Sodalis endosymbiont of Spalangia cameroni]|uniref:XRE family transcriptional regulator n=1 Tax=Sodalis praecaptivus TaxID=1239307 RepID=UPI0031F7259F
MKIGQKIRQLRKARNMTIQELADEIGSDVGNISRLERGIQGYTQSTVTKIAEALSVPVAELFSLSSQGVSAIESGVSSIAKKRRKTVYRIDVLDVSASAGSGCSSGDFIEVVSSIEYTPEQAKIIFGNKDNTAVKLINVRGDSMEGTIDPGDLIFVDISVNYFDGDGIYVFDFNGDLYVKRLQKVKASLYVISDNPRYKEWAISPEEFQMLHVAGRVMLSQSQQFRRHG